MYYVFYKTTDNIKITFLSEKKENVKEVIEILYGNCLIINTNVIENDYLITY